MNYKPITQTISEKKNNDFVLLQNQSLLKVRRASGQL
jgi:hypothetical protein